MGFITPRSGVQVSPEPSCIPLSAYPRLLIGRGNSWNHRWCCLGLEESWGGMDHSARPVGPCLSPLSRLGEPQRGLDRSALDAPCSRSVPHPDYGTRDCSSIHFGPDSAAESGWWCCISAAQWDPKTCLNHFFDLSSLGLKVHGFTAYPLWTQEPAKICDKLVLVKCKSVRLRLSFVEAGAISDQLSDCGGRCPTNDSPFP